MGSRSLFGSSSARLTGSAGSRLSPGPGSADLSPPALPNGTAMTLLHTAPAVPGPAPTALPADWYGAARPSNCRHWQPASMPFLSRMT